MSEKEEIYKLIDSVEATSSKPLYLVAFTDYEEEKYKEWYPGVEILREPLKMDANKKQIL